MNNQQRERMKYLWLKGKLTKAEKAELKQLEELAGDKPMKPVGSGKPPAEIAEKVKPAPKPLEVKANK